MSTSSTPEKGGVEDTGSPSIAQQKDDEAQKITVTTPTPMTLSSGSKPPLFGEGAQIGVLQPCQGLFTSNSTPQGTGSIFGTPTAQTNVGFSGSTFGGGGGFGGTTTQTGSVLGGTGFGVFGSSAPCLFGGGTTQTLGSGGLFGGTGTQGGINLFGATGTQGGINLFGGTRTPPQSGGTQGSSDEEEEDDDADDVPQPPGCTCAFGASTKPMKWGGMFLGSPQAQQKAKEVGASGPQTLFYLVCGGELVPEKEKQSREQMDMIYQTIVETGMAKKEQITFIHGRGQELNKSVVNSFESRGYEFKMYGPHFQQYQGFGFGARPVQKGCLLPRAMDNAVVIFIGQGNYSYVASQNHGAFGAPAVDFNKLADPLFGDLVFVDSSSNSTSYEPSLQDLRAKNTLFISLADYSGEAFERAFAEGYKKKTKKLFVMCLSDSLHSPADNCLGRAFSEFFREDGWKERTLDEFNHVVEGKYVGHPAVTEMKESIMNYTEELFDEELQKRSTWATGNFGKLVHQPIPSYDWAMFREVEGLRQTLDEANVAEVSTDMKEKLDGFIEQMETLRVEAIEKNLHKPKAYEVVGEADICTMTWKDFLLLED